MSTVTCDANCTFRLCGDGFVNPQGGEECDDGNADDTDACRNDCTLPP
jgi:cysteine-rich repeat protein